MPSSLRPSSGTTWLPAGAQTLSRTVRTERPPVSKVVKYRFAAAIRTRDRIVARNVPFDVLGQQGLDLFNITSRVHRVLSRMKPLKKLTGSRTIHGCIVPNRRRERRLPDASLAVESIEIAYRRADAGQ